MTEEKELLRGLFFCMLKTPGFTGEFPRASSYEESVT